MKVAIEVPIGELFDKISILEIKLNKVTDPDKHANIRTELHTLYGVANQLDKEAIFQEYKDLKRVNETLWDIEDKIRMKEKSHRFDNKFIDLARGVYYTNDRRADLKRVISEKLGSHLIEEKQYVEYKGEDSDG